MNKIYLDYASTTPLDPEVLKAMQPYFSGKFGNPGSLHSFGQEAIMAIDESRETIAKAIGAQFNEIIFTGSATEANNLALRGVARIFSRGTSCLFAPAAKSSLDSRQIDSFGGQAQSTSETFRSKTSAPPRIVVSAIEHESVLETARDLQKDGIEVIYIPVDKSGVVNLKKLEAALNERTVLVSVMYANNEVGTVEPISEISQILRNFREGMGYGVRGLGKKLYPIPYTLYPIFHTDAAQAFQYLDCDVNKLGVDLMTLSAHKIYGPKGAAALYVRGTNSKSQIPNHKQITNSKFQTLYPSGYWLNPIITGGRQEFGLRSGTENVPLIVGFAKAVGLVDKRIMDEGLRIMKLRDYLWTGIKKNFPKAEINGIDPLSIIHYPLSRLPNNLNVYLPGIESQFFLTKLDLAGIAASSGSACRARALMPSRVIEALGYSKERAKQSMRFTLGKYTTKAEIDKVLKIAGN